MDYKKILTRAVCVFLSISSTVIICMTFPCSASAADYYVKTPADGGSDANSGLSWKSAKATIGGAMDLAVAGDNIFVAAGTYNEKVSFAHGDNIALRGGYPAAGHGIQDPAANPTIIDGTGLISPYPMVKIPFQPNLSNGYFGIVVEGFIIRNGTHTGNGAGGIESYSMGVTIKRNIIENNHCTGAMGFSGGIYIFGPLYDAGKTVIENNIVRNNSAPAVGGIYIEGAGMPTNYFAYLVNNLVVGNQSTTTDPSWHRGVGGIDVMYPAAASIVNCTIADNTADHPSNAIPGISLIGYSASEKAIAAIVNSIIWHPTGKDIVIGPHSSLWIAFSCVRDQTIKGTGVIHNDPQFAGVNDYRLAAGSPCRDTGSSSGTILSGPIRTTQFSYLPCIVFKNPPYNYTDAHVTLSWGDGVNNLTGQWQYDRASGSATYGRFFGTNNINCNADVSAGISLGETIPVTVDASTYMYRSNYSIAKRDPFTAKETIFWKGTNGYYGAWRIDGIGVTRFDPYSAGRLSGVWYFQTNAGPYFDSGIRSFDIRGVSRPFGTGYDMGAYEYWVDTVPPTGSIAINGGASCTRSLDVTLNLAASDPSGVAEMRFSNDGISWTEPEPYSENKSWLMLPGYGAKTVYVKFKDGVGNWSDPFVDTIFFPEPGDFDNSGEVGLGDVILLLQIIAGIQIEGQPAVICADVNDDNKIDLLDAIFVLQSISK